MDGSKTDAVQLPGAAEPVANDTGDVRELRIDGFRCRYRVSGTTQCGALPIVFLGGAFQAMASWSRFVAHFERHARVLVTDLPGTGSADLLPSRYGLDFLAASLDRVMSAAGIERACVVGASYGSPIAWRFAKEYRPRVARLVLAGVMRTIPMDLRARTHRTVELVEAGQMQAFARLVTGHLLCRNRPVERASLIRRVLMAQLEHMGGDDRLRYIENTRRLLQSPPLDLAHSPDVPALVFTGEHDVYTRPAACREMAAAMPDAVFTTLHHADHLFHVGRFEATLALIAAFHAHGVVPVSEDWTPPQRFTGQGRVEDARRA